MRVIPLLVILVTGCMGQIGSPPPGGDDDQPPPDATARELFDSQVHPILARCGGGACHSTDAMTSTAQEHFYSPDTSTTYTAITAAPLTVGEFNSIAPILTKIDAGHQTVSYTPAERTKILDWLTAEADERSGGQPPAADPTALLEAWSGCMTQDNFDTAQMAEKLGNSNASNGQACKNCHGDSAFGFTASPDSTQYFTAISTSQSQLLKYFSVSQGAVIINMAALTNAGQSIADHPRFDPTTLPGIDALQSFYDLTAAAQTAGGCGPSKLVNP